MTSNCYVVYDDDTNHCLIIDPASERSEKEINFLEGKRLTLDYIILTHEHTDHNWGVNALRNFYADAKLICSEMCNEQLKRTNRVYFLYYYDDPNYRYEIAPADILISQQLESKGWHNLDIHFILTPGHSYGSMCIEIGGLLFTGDTIMPFKPYFNGRDSYETDWYHSIGSILELFPKDTLVYPGHGDSLTLNNWKEIYYINKI